MDLSNLPTNNGLGNIYGMRPTFSIDGYTGFFNQHPPNSVVGPLGLTKPYSEVAILDPQQKIDNYISVYECYRYPAVNIEGLPSNKQEALEINNYPPTNGDFVFGIKMENTETVYKYKGFSFQQLCLILQNEYKVGIAYLKFILKDPNKVAKLINPLGYYYTHNLIRIRSIWEKFAHLDDINNVINAADIKLNIVLFLKFCEEFKIFELCSLASEEKINEEKKKFLEDPDEETKKKYGHLIAFANNVEKDTFFDEMQYLNCTFLANCFSMETISKRYIYLGVCYSCTLIENTNQLSFNRLDVRYMGPSVLAFALSPVFGYNVGCRLFWYRIGLGPIRPIIYYADFGKLGIKNLIKTYFEKDEDSSSLLIEDYKDIDDDVLIDYGSPIAVQKFKGRSFMNVSTMDYLNLQYFPVKNRKYANLSNQDIYTETHNDQKKIKFSLSIEA